MRGNVWDTRENVRDRARVSASLRDCKIGRVGGLPTLAWLEERLSTRRWLMGDTFTLGDIRLFTTLVRFDAVYYVHFKCNLHRIEERPHLAAFIRAVYQLPGVAETVDLEQIKLHYYGSHATINPTGIVPEGPRFFDAPTLTLVRTAGANRTKGRQFRAHPLVRIGIRTSGRIGTRMLA